MGSTETAASTTETFQAPANAPLRGEQGFGVSASDKGIAANKSVNNGAALNGRKGSNNSGNHSGNGASNSARSWKGMLEVMKKLHSDAGKLQDKISGMHCDFSELTLKATHLFDATSVQILTDSCPEIGGLKDPQEVHFTRKEVDDAYEDLSQMMRLQGPPEEQEL